MKTDQPKELKQSRIGVFDSILDAVPQPIFVKDSQFRFRYVNEAACTFFGRKRREVIGCTDYDFRTDREAKRIRELDQRVLRTGDQLVLEEEITLPGGAVRTVMTHRCRTKLTTAPAEQVVVTTLLDVSAQRRAEAELKASEEHYRALIELHPQVPWTANPSGEVLEMGPRWKTTGFDPTDALGTRWAQAMHPDDLADVQRQWSHSLKTGQPLDIEFRLRSVEGGYCWFRSRAAARRANDGKIVRWYGTVENIDDRRKALEALRESEARFRAIADDAPAMIWVTNETGDNDYHSRLWLETTGQTADQAAGKGWLRAIHPDDRQGVEASFNHAFTMRTSVRTEYRLLRAEGGSAWIIDIGQPRFAANGKFLGFVGIGLDITERRNAELERSLAKKKIHHMARHDALTGLPNRQFLSEEFELLSREIAPGTQIAFFCLQLDGFKGINDAYGRSAGDVLLRRVAERLRESVLQSDIICRLGGDEFGVLRIGVKSDDEARNLAQQLTDVVKATYELAGTPIDLGVIIGLTVAPTGGRSLDAFIQDADIALDHARVFGRGSYVQYEPGMDAHLRTKQEMNVALRRALDRDELEIRYQPLLNLYTGQISSFEALVRWSHPERGSVSPAEFIPIAEETGLIGPLGEQVLRKACAEAAAWPTDISVAVNLSPLQFRDQDLARTVSSVVENSGLDASRLQLEITESVLLDESQSNLQLLRDIRQLGVKIAIDDFGTGFSSLSYLRSFRFDKIKVDRSFVADLPDGKESLAILRAVAAIGRSLGIVTTVEGIERQDQLELIKSEGFDEAQGYLFSRPLSAEQARGLIQRQPREVAPT